jgi:hypothetical protein
VATFGGGLTSAGSLDELQVDLADVLTWTYPA